MNTASERPTDPDDLTTHDRPPGVAWEAGLRAGRDTADRWAHDTLAGRAADIAAAARRILAGFANGDSTILDLPALSLDDLDRAAREAYTAATPDGPVWTAAPVERRTEATGAYLDGYTTGLIQRAGERCRVVLHALTETDDHAVLPEPTTAQRVASGTGDLDTLEHLHPDRLRIGGVGVFAGDWAWTRDAHGRDRIRVAFVGVFVDVWNGWAVFSCTRTVAEAIVADQESMREVERAQLITAGRSGADLDTAVDQLVTPMRFDGDDIIVDQSATYPEDGDAAIERIHPNEQGQYVVMGGAWCWTAVEPGDCDRIVGDLPTPAEQQQYVVFTHVAGMSAPHDRLQVTALEQRQTRDGVAFTAGLSLDGRRVGTVVNRGVGDATVWTLNGAGFGTADLQQYADACRHHGEPMTVEQVLTALVTEYDLTRLAAAADTTGDTLLRAVDDDGTLLELLTVTDVRPGRGRREALRHLVAARPAHPSAAQWEIWGGTAWRHLHRIPLATPAPEDGTPETPH